MSQSHCFSLEEYQVQRQYREQKRKEYLRKFELLKHQMGVVQQSPLPSLVDNGGQPMPKKQSDIISSSEQAVLLSDNEQLKNELVSLEQKQRKNLESFKSRISDVKGKYMEQIKKISHEAKQNQSEAVSRAEKLSQQIESAQLKNTEVQQFNDKIQEQIRECNSMMDKYGLEIQKEYAQKIEEFEQVFESSSQKIEAMEKEYEDEEFIANIIENGELIDTIKENAEKASEDIEKILSDYKQLLEGKTEIDKQLTSNNELKASEIKKMGDLEQKLKIVFEKLNEQKKIYVDENSKMAEQLMQVKALLMTSMGQANGK